MTSLAQRLQADIPGLRGRLEADFPLRDITWFRVGGPAEVLYTPVDEDDLALFFRHLPADVPWCVIGLGSNLLVRDGGIAGVVIRMGRGFNGVRVLDRVTLAVGTAVPDVKVARAAQEAGIGGMAFLRGIPGGIGGALRMNAGAHGGEIKDLFVSARAVTRSGTVVELTPAMMGFHYRHTEAPQDLVFTEATLRGVESDPAVIAQAMEAVVDQRQATQPVNARTGGSTFKNPQGGKAWQLIDAAGCRGLRIGGAEVSTLHCNFLLNTGDATAHDIETLGETVRERVFATSGVRLEWEIKRMGVSLGEPI